MKSHIGTLDNPLPGRSWNIKNQHKEKENESESKIRRITPAS